MIEIIEKRAKKKREKKRENRLSSIVFPFTYW